MASQYKVNPNTNQIEQATPTGWSQSAFDTTYKGILGGTPVTSPANPANPANPTIPTDPNQTFANGNANLAAILAKLQGQETPEAVYNRLYASSGIQGQETNVTNAQNQVNEAQNQVSKVDDLLNNLEADIASRVSGSNSIITDAMGRRESAVRGTPLRNQYAQLVKGQGVAQQGLTQAQSGLSNARTDFTNMYNAQTKQTPYEDLVKTIAEEQAKKAINPTEPKYQSVSPGQAVIDPSTGKVIYQAPAKADNTETEKQQKIVDSFNKDLTSWNMAGTREQLIRQLQARYPDVNKDDIERKVYETYPDSYKNEQP